MKKAKLLSVEKAQDQAISLSGYFNVKREDFDVIVKSLAGRRKDAVLNMRVNSRDLKRIKSKAQKMGVKYQTLISELIHRVAAEESHEADAGVSI